MYNAIRFLYPAAIPNEDFRLECHDGITTEIAFWNSSKLGSQPSRAQIDAAMPLAIAALIMSAIRAERDRRLAATDFQMMPDYPAAKKPAGLDAYRQALRDFPAAVDAATLSWPPDVAALNWPMP